MSLNMLIETEGGFDYTAADCMGWMTDAGFSNYAGRAPGRAGLDGDRNQVAPRAPALERLRQARIVTRFQGVLVNTGAADGGER